MIEQNKNFVQSSGGEFAFYHTIRRLLMPGIIVTNGRQMVIVPFEDGEMTAVALQRA